MKTHVRCYRPSDAARLARLFFESVRQGALSAYTCEQTEAWVPEVPESNVWATRLNSLHVFVAEDESGLAGFMTLDDSGYIDLAFVRPDRIGTGVGSALYNSIEQLALIRKMESLSSYASELARPMFEQNGWTVGKTQKTEKRGVTLLNHYMEKRLA